MCAGHPEDNPACRKEEADIQSNEKKKKKKNRGKTRKDLGNLKGTGGKFQP